MAVQTLARLATLDAECTKRRAARPGHGGGIPADHTVITSFPGLGDLTGARILAELGDDRRRFTDARAVKAYAGSAPVTRASGRTTSITHRRAKNQRPCAVGFVWAFMAITNHPPARSHYGHRREQGDHHAAALRHLFNRLIGQLHHCLQTGQLYDAAKAFDTPTAPAA